jgi:hypothetical protein
MSNLKMNLTLVLVLFSMCAVRAVAQSRKTQAFPAETYVLQELMSGNIANLQTKFPSEKERVLRASFLENLVMNEGKLGIHRNGIRIKGAFIPDALNLANSEIPNYIELTDCHFKDVSFFQTTFKKGLTIDDTVFEGKPNFAYATIMEGLTATKARFVNTTEMADFTCIKITGPTSFDGATFSGPVTFLYAVIDGSFSVKNAKFINKDAEVSFNSMKIDRGFFAADATFEGAVNLVNLKTGDNFEAERAHFNNADRTAKFQMITLALNLFLAHAEFAGGVDFGSANVNANVELDDAKFSSAASFRGMKAGSISINDTVFAVAPNFTNLTYQEIYPSSRVLTLIGNSSSDYTAYTQLESSLQKKGYTSEADNVFIQKKRLERNSLGPWAASVSFLADAVHGFGRRPYRVILFDIAIVGIGALVFRRQIMVQKATNSESGKSGVESSHHPPPYNPLLYSLTLFAPGIDTQYTNNWRPSHEKKNVLHYAWWHKAFGWVLVSLTLAIWTGVFHN